MKVRGTKIAGMHMCVSITPGKLYEAKELDDGLFELIGDDGELCKFHPDWVEPVEDEQQPLEAQNVVQPKTIDSHYNFDYVLTEADREKGVVKIDPYFVAKQWRLGSKDDTGVLFHCLKNISRYSDKNTKEREIKALYLQIKRLAELEKVSLNEMVLEILKKS